MTQMNRRADYSHYDDMTTAQLQEILRKHAHGELEATPDTEELFYIMGVLRDRAKSDPDKKVKSTEEAYKIFVKYYAPEMAEGKPIPFTKRYPVARWAKRVAVLAAICATLMVAAVSAEAFVPGWWGRVSAWTKGIFSFEDVSIGTEGKEPSEQLNLELRTLQEALDIYSITQPLVPSWLPDGYVALDVKTVRTPREISISASYANGDRELVIKIRQTVGAAAQKIEKMEGLIDVYSVNGIEYFLFDNNGVTQAAWVVDEFECLITGNVTMDEMKAIIDSI